MAKVLAIRFLLILLVTSSFFCHDIPVIELTDEINVFPSNSKHQNPPYFRHLSVDRLDPNRIYAGGLDYVYRLQARDISKGAEKSSNLSASSEAALLKNKYNCGVLSEDMKYACNNHIRAVIAIRKDQLYVCSTGSGYPMLYYLHAENLQLQKTLQNAGKARCPYEPYSNFTYVFSEKGGIDYISLIYSATMANYGNTEPVIFRPQYNKAPLHKAYNAHDEDDDEDAYEDYSDEKHIVQLLRTEDDPRLLDEAYFVASFDIGDYIYVFFRERAIESEEKVIYSRIGRVCKKDIGNPRLDMKYRFTSFVKARLNCSLLHNSVPFYFNEIYDAAYNETEQAFYALFNSLHGGIYGSAICHYRLQDVLEVFQSSPFKGKKSMSEGWAPITLEETPEPRPGNCVDDSTLLNNHHLHFIKSNPLLHHMINPFLPQKQMFSSRPASTPIFVTYEDLSVNRMLVHHTHSFIIFYLSSSRGTVYRVVTWSEPVDTLTQHTFLRHHHKKKKNKHFSKLSNKKLKSFDNFYDKTRKKKKAKHTRHYNNVNNFSIGPDSQKRKNDHFHDTILNDYKNDANLIENDDRKYENKFRICSVLRPVRTFLRPIHQLIIHQPPATNETYLYFTTDDLVVQLNVLLCSHHHQCVICALDPYCGWDVVASRCMPYKHGLLQNISGSAEEACAKSCSLYKGVGTRKLEVVEGGNMHLDCSSECMSLTSLQPHSKIIWQFADSQSARLIENDKSNYVVSQDYSLLILNVKDKHNGVFSCRLNNIIIARHQLIVTPCSIGEDIEKSWKSNFQNWCSAYQEYKMKYSLWSCFMNECLKEGCIPKRIIDTCSH